MTAGGSRPHSRFTSPSRDQGAVCLPQRPISVLLCGQNTSVMLNSIDCIATPDDQKHARTGTRQTTPHLWYLLDAWLGSHFTARRECDALQLRQARAPVFRPPSPPSHGDASGCTPRTACSAHLCPTISHASSSGGWTARQQLHQRHRRISPRIHDTAQRVSIEEIGSGPYVDVLRNAHSIWRTGGTEERVRKVLSHPPLDSLLC